jgi:hypothetical protein
VYSLIAPHAAASGETVLVRGIRFPRFQKAVVILAGRPVAEARTNSIGNFATGFVVPPGTQPGVLPVVSQAGGRQVAASVRIVTGALPSYAVTTASNGATLEVSPVGGRPGTHVRLVATGLPPGQPVTVWLSDSRWVSGRSSATGAFVRTRGIPGLLFGRRSLELVSGRLAMKSYLDVHATRPRPRPPGAVTIAAAGDIACQPGAPQTDGTCRYRETAELVSHLNPTVVAALGDNQLHAGTLAAFAGAFDGTWGLLKARIRPALGNHEYLTPGASGYFTYFGAAAHPPGGWYAYDLGAWHVVVLNSNCTIVSCAPGSPQETWLRANLASRRTRCTLAYFHHPRFSSAGRFLTPTLLPIWTALYQHGVDVVLNGHAHVYERFAPQDPSGNPDPARGIRQFTVGSGGNGHIPFVGIRRNSRKRLSAFGVLHLALRPGSYKWQFMRIPDGVTRDAGSDRCH